MEHVLAFLCPKNQRNSKCARKILTKGDEDIDCDGGIMSLIEERVEQCSRIEIECKLEE